jgi:hypothetical protein
MEDRKPTICNLRAGQLTEPPIANEKLIKWLNKRREVLQKEHDDAEDIAIKKAKGARLKQVKDTLNYIHTH